MTLMHINVTQAIVIVTVIILINATVLSIGLGGMLVVIGK